MFKIQLATVLFIGTLIMPATVHAQVCGNNVIELGEDCDDGNTLDGDCCSSACAFEAALTACGDPAITECTNPDSCDGAGVCDPRDELTSTTCGFAGDGLCDTQDTCDGVGACVDNVEPTTTVCRAVASECDVAEFCDGAGTCPVVDVQQPVGTSCGNTVTSVCDNADSCDGLGNCNANNIADGASCTDGTFCNGAESCLAGVCELGPSECVNVCEQCNETNASCDWCSYDQNRNGATDGFDFAFFSGCFGSCFAVGDPCFEANYDKDTGGCVGGSDFGGLSGCFGLACGACTTCFGPAAAPPAGINAVASYPPESVIRVVVTQHMGDVDFADTLPDSQKAFAEALPLFLEIWATRNELGPNGDKGLASLYVNLKFDSSILVVEDTIHTSPFATLAFDTVDNLQGHIKNLGGCAPLGDGTMGLDSSWVRIAVVKARSTHSGATSVSLTAAMAPFGVSLFDRLGDLKSSQIDFGTIDFTINTKIPNVRVKRAARQRINR